MPFFSEVREAFRDKRRKELCADLQSLGIDAQMAPRGRVEENTYTDPILSLGVIDILDGPIRWVNVTCRLTSDEETTRHLVYGVPDPKVRPGFPEVRINAIPIRERERFWLSRRVTGVRWEGNDFGLGIVQHVWPNVLIPRAFLESLGVDSFEIRADPDRGCWILTVQDVVRWYPKTRQLAKRESSS